MSDDRPETRLLDCTECFALPGPGPDKVRVRFCGPTGPITEMWHTRDCPRRDMTEIMNDESRRQAAQEAEAWAEGVFPGVYERLKRAAAALPVDTPERPFVAALTELVQAQAEDTGGSVTLPTWVKILERHFPPDLPDSNHTTE
ncbi:hypothetical protein QCN29_33730 [Streptomyces sp. HNM0663]|uniref:Uncharacterized protein n=1 Tax=Streptomyces chengmaiensis TaxID=3040919 RepID=A0ABT6HY47_9ACTN|nr:hypothetical protein [Streptomyces chengmaiensis]MDH2393637.1 hypothetical protein [Streptomyces chengmaiensis]